MNIASLGFAEFADFAQLAQFSLRQYPDRTEVATIPGGETRYVVRKNDLEGYLLTRSDRSEPERHVMWSEDPTDIERYLTMILGNSAREYRGLRRLDFPTDEGEIRGKFICAELAPGTFGLISSDDVLLAARFPYVDVLAPIIRFSAIAFMDPRKMRQSYLDPEGKPLFSLWMGPHGTPAEN